MSLKFSSVRHGPLAAERRLLRVLYTEMYLAWQERPDPTELTRGEWKKRLYARVALVCHFYENLDIKVILVSKVCMADRSFFSFTFIYTHGHIHSYILYKIKSYTCMYVNEQNN